MTLQGLSLGTLAPCPSITPCTGYIWHPLMGSALTFPSVWWQWSHHGSPGACSGLAALPTEGLPSPWKPHLSSGALQVSERFIRDNPSVHTIRKVSWLLAGIAAAGENLAHFTALAVQCYSLKTCVYPCPDLNLKRDVTLKGGCGVLALFLKLSICNKINSRKRRRGKPSSLQI